LDDAFAQADLDTGLIERRHDTLFPPASPATDRQLALALAALLARQGLLASERRRHTVPLDPWSQADGWRLAGAYQQAFTLTEGDSTHALTVSRDGHAWSFARQADSHPFEWKAEPGTEGKYQVRVRLAGEEARATVVIHGEQVHVFSQGGVRVLQQHDPVSHASDEAAGHGGSLTAPMPGKIFAVSVKPGDSVKAGDTLLVMEAMKMEHTITAPADGTVGEIFFEVGDQVGDGAELIAMES